MTDIICYLKLSGNVELQKDEIFLKDVASIRCADKNAAAKIKSIKVYQFPKEEKKEERRCVISVLKIIELIEERCPNVKVESLGEVQVLIERILETTHKGAKQAIKTVLICGITFFGTAFTIMAYHNDVGIADLFAQIHQIVMGSELQGVSPIEVAYSAGLALGIVAFFNHAGGRKFTKDPTPIEVEMKKYETDVNSTLINTAEREGKTIDAN